MSTLNRRRFLQSLAAFSAVCGLPRVVRPASDDARPFEMLVVGDSLIWGQGLNETEKFYNLTRKWLEEVHFGGKRTVNLTNKSHSGSTLFLHDEEAAELRLRERDERDGLDREVPVGFPSIAKQLELARAAYAKAEDVDLIMLTGGITDIAVANILNIFGSEREMRPQVAKYCFGKMSELIGRAAEMYPRALVAVIGYYPIISNKTSTHAMFNAVLEVFGFPRVVKPFLNNPLTLPILKMMRKNAIRRSDFWADNSEAEIGKAIAELNRKCGSRRAVYVKSPVTRETCFGTKNSLLWGMAKNGRAADRLYDARRAACAGEYTNLANNQKLGYSIRKCDLSAIGHPNVEGSKAYADAIAKTIGPILEDVGGIPREK